MERIRFIPAQVKTFPDERPDARPRRPRVELSGNTWTNNVTERAAGGGEIRYKTVRGYRGEEWTLNGFGLKRRAWSGRDGPELSGMVAAPRRSPGELRPPKTVP